LNKTRTTNITRKSENKELLDRWILLKEKEAASLNEANEFVTT
jgi:hypothetical protein